jgi:alkanesulfonate monooxygenase SsuD/methylene tetrahydromethanopterin reductase-like flavin-dependent oxidoreductase (luciferase family)
MTMQFGVCDIAVDPTDQFLELVRHMEESGWDSLWVVDCVLHSRDTFAYLGAASQHSRRLRLGTNIVNPVSRHPAVNLVGITNRRRPDRRPGGVRRGPRERLLPP